LRKNHVTDIVVDSSHNDGTNHQQPIGKGNINLSVKGRAGVDHCNVWKVARVHDLGEKLEGTGD